MTCAEIVQVCLPIISLLVTGLLAVWQVFIAKRVERFEKRQDSRDELRYSNMVLSEAIKFIQRYNTADVSELELLPLCAVASYYDSTFQYRRKIYNDFCILPKDVQFKVLELRSVESLEFSGDLYFAAASRIKDIASKKCITSGLFMDNMDLIRGVFDTFIPVDVPRLHLVGGSFIPCDDKRFDHTWNVIKLKDVFDRIATPIHFLLTEMLCIVETLDIENKDAVREHYTMYISFVIAEYLLWSELDDEVKEKRRFSSVFMFRRELTMEDLFLRLLYESYLLDSKDGVLGDN